jgi:hypothetical protein
MMYECFTKKTYLLYRGYYNKRALACIKERGRDAEIDYAATYTGHVRLSELFLLRSEHYQ